MKTADEKKNGGTFKRLVEKIVFRIKLRDMDNRWYAMGASCWELFPPSFYYTHTEEEIKRITEETVRSLKELIDKME